MDPDSLEKCAICQGNKREPRVLRCNHSFCAECLENMAEYRGRLPWADRCPICRARIGEVGYEEFQLDPFAAIEAGINTLISQIALIQRQMDLMQGQHTGMEEAPSVSAPVQAESSHWVNSMPTAFGTQEREGS